MAESKGIKRYLELLLDKAKADKTQRDAQNALNKGTDPRKAEQNLSKIDRAFDGIGKAALKIGGILAGVFALGKIKDFGVAAVRAATESQAVWSQLGATLQGVGIDFAGVKGEIEAAAAAIQDTTTMGDEDFAKSLQTLVLLSGDYAGSMKNVALVADLAAAKTISFEEAAQAVGKAMGGSTTALERWFPRLKDSSDAIGDLTAQLEPQAEAMRGTWAGGIKALSEGWGNFKEAVGGAMLEAGGGTSILETLIGIVKAMTGWVENNKEGLVKWVGGGIGVAVDAIKMLWVGVQDLIDLLQTGFRSAAAVGADALSMLADAAALATEAKAKFLALFSDEWEAKAKADAEHIRSQAKALREYAAAASRAAAADRDAIRARHEAGANRPIGGRPSAPPARAIPGASQPAGPSGTSGGNTLPAVIGTARPDSGPTAQVIGGASAGGGLNLNPFEGFGDPQSWAKEQIEPWTEAMLAMGDSGAMVAANMENAFEGLFAAIGNGFDESATGFHSWGDAAIGVGGAVAAGLAEGLGNYARAEAALAFATGIWPPNPAALAKGAAMLVAASMLDAVAGAGSNAGMRQGAGRGGMPDTGSGARAGSRIAEKTERAGPEVNIYLSGEFDMMNPQLQRAILGTEQRAKETYGENSRITVRPKPGGGK